MSFHLTGAISAAIGVNNRLAPIKKNNYVAQNFNLVQQTQVEGWKAKKSATLNGTNIPLPILSLTEQSFEEPIRQLLGNAKMTAIQSIAWPIALSGRDMLSVAHTVDGETLGFVLPAIVHVRQQSARQPGDGPFVIVLLPTKDLVREVEKVARKFCGPVGLAASGFYRGAPTKAEQELRDGVDICVGTPDCLSSAVAANITNFSRCSLLVLAQVDGMLDLDFEQPIRTIIGQIRADRQTLMFSAGTWAEEVQQLATAFLSDPVSSVISRVTPTITFQTMVIRRFADLAEVAIFSIRFQQKLGLALTKASFCPATDGLGGLEFRVDLFATMKATYKAAAIDILPGAVIRFTGKDADPVFEG